MDFVHPQHHSLKSTRSFSNASGCPKARLFQVKRGGYVSKNTCEAHVRGNPFPFASAFVPGLCCFCCEPSKRRSTHEAPKKVEVWEKAVSPEKQIFTFYSKRPNKKNRLRAVGNDHFCDTTKGSPKDYHPHLNKQFPCITEVGINPLIPQP